MVNSIGDSFDGNSFVNQSRFDAYAMVNRALETKAAIHVFYKKTIILPEPHFFKIFPNLSLRFS